MVVFSSSAANYLVNYPIKKDGEQDGEVKKEKWNQNEFLMSFSLISVCKVHIIKSI